MQVYILEKKAGKSEIKEIISKIRQSGTSKEVFTMNIIAQYEDGKDICLHISRSNLAEYMQEKTNHRSNYNFENEI